MMHMHGRMLGIFLLAGHPGVTAPGFPFSANYTENPNTGEPCCLLYVSHARAPGHPAGTSG
jgi:hypothetical protein